MIKRFFHWWNTRIQAAYNERNLVERAKAMENQTVSVDGGMQFQLIKAENGKILKVTQAASHNPMLGNFQPPTDKLYVIGEGEDVMAFITRALVEERIK